MDLTAFKTLCEMRRSVRYFDTNKDVSKEEIMELITIAESAPSIENMQPWHFHVITDPKLKTSLTETCCYGNFLAGSSVFIVVTCNKAAMPKTQEIVWNPREIEYSCVTAMDTFLLAATAKGLATCWVSLHHGKPHELLGLDKDEVVIGGIMVGHFRDGEEEPGSGHIRKQAESTVTFHE